MATSQAVASDPPLTYVLGSYQSLICLTQLREVNLFRPAPRPPPNRPPRVSLSPSPPPVGARLDHARRRTSPSTSAPRGPGLYARHPRSPPSPQPSAMRQHQSVSPPVGAWLARARPCPTAVAPRPQPTPPDRPRPVGRVFTPDIPDRPASRPPRSPTPKPLDPPPAPQT